jgi:hypothetical protein
MSLPAWGMVALPVAMDGSPATVPVCHLAELFHRNREVNPALESHSVARWQVLRNNADHRPRRKFVVDSLPDPEAIAARDSFVAAHIFYRVACGTTMTLSMSGVRPEAPIAANNSN